MNHEIQVINGNVIIDGEIAVRSDLEKMESGEYVLYFEQTPGQYAEVINLALHYLLPMVEADLLRFAVVRAFEALEKEMSEEE
ncbi:MAG: hypothetical protein J2P31_16625 [Blastocatellia bacterium]|nr:hypothetical protein [Blastocatellia bacterium]